MKKFILGLTWQGLGFLGAIGIIQAAVPYQWDYNGITGLWGSILGLDLGLPLVACLLLFAAGCVFCVKGLQEK